MGVYVSLQKVTDDVFEDNDETGSGEAHATAIVAEVAADGGGLAVQTAFV